jgi:oligogalacturonide lyase
MKKIRIRIFILLLIISGISETNAGTLKGKIYPAASKKLVSQKDGFEIKQFMADNCKLYCTTNPYIQKKDILVFYSTRNGKKNLFYINLKTYEITQITDGKKIDGEHAVVNPEILEVFYEDGNYVKSINIETFEEKNVYIFNKESQHLEGSISVSSDGRFVAMPFSGKMGKTVLTDIIVVDRTDYTAQMAARYPGIINHVILSPNNTEKLIYTAVNKGIFIANITGQDNRLIKAKTEDENPDHPFWFTDGQKIGYLIKTKGQEYFEIYDSQTNKNIEKIKIPEYNNYCRINQDETLLVGDGDPKKTFINIYSFKNNVLENIFKYKYGNSFSKQVHFPHPVFIDNKTFIFNGNGNIYMIKIIKN